MTYHPRHQQPDPSSGMWSAEMHTELLEIARNPTWREAIPSDVVCVTPDVRTQTANDNAAASSRVAGSDDCISGYVWREAFSGDRVCVTPAVKSQVAADNAAAPSHTNP